ncbi:MAG TPA: ATP-binding protein, partial [Minicystis sp.]|nr:ATP-binding protein [Minicystis sp.]
ATIGYEGSVGRVLPLTQATQTAFVLRSGEPLVVEDLAEETRFSPSRDLVSVGVVSGVSAIIGERKQPFGVLTAHSRARRAFDRHDVEFVEALANVLAQAVAHEREGAARRDAERRLAEREALFRTVIEQGLDTTEIVEADGTLRYASPSLRDLVGYAPEELVGTNALALVHAEDLPRARAVLARLAESGTREPAEMRLVRKDGSICIAECVATSCLDHPAVRGIVVHARDITARREAELARRELEAQLRHAQKMDAMGQLAGGVAHDFNNLLTVVTTCSELLLRGFHPDDPRRPDAVEIRHAAELASALTRQLLAFSRKQPQNPRPVDVGAIVANAKKMLARLLGERIELAFDVAPRLPLVHVDPAHVEQVLLNLAVNARDALPDGGRIDVAVRAVDGPPEGVSLTVRDRGTGMDRATLAHAFEPFFTTKEPGKGTGLGLSTVYGIVKQAGGDVDVESALGVGTVVTVRFPALPARDDAAEADPASGPPSQGETLLLVEDDAHVRRVLTKNLAGLGYRVLEASSGAEALAVAGREPGAIHVVVSDVVMPGLAARDLVARLRAERPGVRALFISGYTPDEVLREQVEAGDAALLAKPFTATELAARVRRVLDEPAD